MQVDTAPQLALEPAPATTPAEVTPAEIIQPAEAPTFDFSDLSWDEGLYIADLSNIIQPLADILNDPESTVEQRREADRQFRVELEKVRVLFARTVLTMPRAWLVRSAPEAIDWTDVANYGRYVRNTHGNRMLPAMIEALAAEAEKKA